MSAITSSPSRFAVCIAVSLALNAAAWTLAGGALLYRVAAPLPPIEIQRVILDRKGHKTVKVVKPKDIAKKVKKVAIQKRLPPPPKVRPVATPPTKPPPRPPEGAHNRILTTPAKTPAAKPPDFTAPSDGNAKLGRPTDAQLPGTAVENPVKTPSAETPKVDTPKVDTPKVDAPKVDTPKVDTPKVDTPKVDTPKVDPPKVEKAKGPTRDAEPVEAIQPKLPDSLDASNLRSFVRVKVHILADGSFEVVLRTSSNNAEVDKILLETLKRWKWKPALQDGEPVESTRLFKFEFEIQ